MFSSVAAWSINRACMRLEESSIMVAGLPVGDCFVIMLIRYNFGPRYSSQACSLVIPLNNFAHSRQPLLPLMDLLHALPTGVPQAIGQWTVPYLTESSVWDQCYAQPGAAFGMEPNEFFVWQAGEAKRFDFIRRRTRKTSSRAGH